VNGPISAVLILGIFASTALAQSEQVVTDRHRILANWLGTVRAAETKYKSKYGVYADLTGLRNAHLLEDLIFESDKPTETAADANRVPKSTLFEVTASSDGKHYKVSICEVYEEVLGEPSICSQGDEMSTGFSKGRRQPLQVPLPDDSPDGPILSLPT
jgi:hypothetical protein